MEPYVHIARKAAPHHVMRWATTLLLSAFCLSLAACSANDAVPQQVIRFEEPLADSQQCEQTLLAAEHSWGEKEFLLTTAYYVPVDDSIDFKDHFFGVPEEARYTGGQAELDEFMREDLTLNSPNSLALFLSDDTKIFRSLTGPMWYPSAAEQACAHAGNGAGLSQVRFVKLDR